MPTKMKNIVITDPIAMPEVYSSSSEAELYATTPGGSRLTYDCSFLKTLRRSPLSLTPPKKIPVCLLRGTPRTPFRKFDPLVDDQQEKSDGIEEPEQFQLDM